MRRGTHLPLLFFYDHAEYRRNRKSRHSYLGQELLILAESYNVHFGYAQICSVQVGGLANLTCLREFARNSNK